MQRADGKLFEAFAEPVCRDALRELLNSDEPLTQGELAQRLDVSSAVMSRRMNALETAGIAVRESAHGPYRLLFPSETRKLLVDGAELAASAWKRQAGEATAHARELRKEGMAGGIIRDRKREAS